HNGALNSMEPEQELSKQSKSVDCPLPSSNSPVTKQSNKSPGGSHHKSKRQDKAPYARRKIPPVRPSQAINDIYINRKTDFSVQLARSHKLLDQGCTELNIHGLGAAIHRAVNLALQLRETCSVPMEISASTSTVDLQDELEPLDDVCMMGPSNVICCDCFDGDYSMESRRSSSIHIRLYQTTPSTVKSDERTASS
ncbi:hypothetical protein EMCRGX_G028301, partial [Ephydatia muelleri]